MPRHKAKQGDAPTWTERQRLAAEILATGLSTQDTASQVGVERASVYRWQNLPGFGALVEAARVKYVDQLRNELRRGARAAIGALVEIASDPEAAPAARVSASTAILDRVGLPRRSEIEATVEGTTSIRVDLTGATLEQLAALAGTDDDGDDG